MRHAPDVNYLYKLNCRIKRIPRIITLLGLDAADINTKHFNTEIGGLGQPNGEHCIDHLSIIPDLRTVVPSRA